MADVRVHDDDGVTCFVSEADINDIVLLIGIGDDDVVVYEGLIPNESSAESVSHVCVGLVSCVFDSQFDHDFSSFLRQFSKKIMKDGGVMLIDLFSIIYIKLEPETTNDLEVPKEKSEKAALSIENFSRDHLHDWHNNTLDKEPVIPEVERYKQYILAESAARRKRIEDMERATRYEEYRAKDRSRKNRNSEPKGHHKKCNKSKKTRYKNNHEQKYGYY